MLEEEIAEAERRIDAHMIAHAAANEAIRRLSSGGAGANRSRRPSLGVTMAHMAHHYAEHPEYAGRKDSLSVMLPNLERRRRSSHVDSLQLKFETK